MEQVLKPAVLTLEYPDSRPDQITFNTLLFGGIVKLTNFLTEEGVNYVEEQTLKIILLHVIDTPMDNRI